MCNKIQIFSRSVLKGLYLRRQMSALLVQPHGIAMCQCSRQPYKYLNIHPGHAKHTKTPNQNTSSHDTSDTAAAFVGSFSFSCAAFSACVYIALSCFI